MAIGTTMAGISLLNGKPDEGDEEVEGRAVWTEVGETDLVTVAMEVGGPAVANGVGLPGPKVDAAVFKIIVGSIEDKAVEPPSCRLMTGRILVEVFACDGRQKLFLV